MERRFLPWAFGLAPVVLFLLTWTDHYHNWWVKTYALPVVAVELAVVVIAFRQGMRIPVNPVTGCLAALLAVAWATVLIAPRMDLALARTLLWTLHALFGFAAAKMFAAEDFVEGMLAGFVLFAAVFAIYVANAPPDISWNYELPGLGNIRRFGFYAAAIIGLCLGRLAGGKWPTAAVLALAFAMTFWTGSRGAVAAAAAGLGASLLLFPETRRPRAWAVFLACGAAGAALAAIIGSPDWVQGTARLTDAGDNGRVEVWRAAIDLIGRRPWLGYGEGQMRDLAQMPYVMHPHDIVLQLLLAWGIIGLLLAAVLGSWAAYRIVCQADERTLPLCCAAIILAAYSLVDGALYNVHPVAIFAACIGMALGGGGRDSVPAAAHPEG